MSVRRYCLDWEKCFTLCVYHSWRAETGTAHHRSSERSAGLAKWEDILQHAGQPRAGKDMFGGSLTISWSRLVLPLLLGGLNSCRDRALLLITQSPYG
eukprot:2067041-Pyramimonas_sp.AAC.1